MVEEPVAPSKGQTIKMVIASLKQELKENFSINPTKGEDGILSKDFMVKLHTLIYKFKKYATEFIAKANFDERITLLREVEATVIDGG